MILNATSLLVSGLIVSTLIIGARPSAAQDTADAQRPGRQYTGTINPALATDPSMFLIQFFPAKPEVLKRLPHPLGPDEKAYFFERILQDKSIPGHPARKRLPLIVVVSQDKPVALYASVTGDSIFTEADRRMFIARPPVNPTDSPGMTEVAFELPLPAGGRYTTFPVHVIYSPKSSEPLFGMTGILKGQIFYLWEKDSYATGTLMVDGKAVPVSYMVSPYSGKMITVGGYYGLDANGDGKIDQRAKTEHIPQMKPEIPVIFNTGGHYLSPSSVDDATGTVVWVERSASDYTPLTVGEPFPEFSFVDLTGTKRQLSDFRGKYVLLDVWEFGCLPCRLEISDLKTAYQRYHDRGFEILGIDMSDPEIFDQVKKLIRDKGMNWTHTSAAMPGSGPSLRAFAEQRMHVTGYPTVILLAPDGTIKSISGPGEEAVLPLRGEALLHTLESVLPKA